MFCQEEESVEEKLRSIKDVIIQNDIKIKTISVLKSKLEKKPYKINIINLTL